MARQRDLIAGASRQLVARGGDAHRELQRVVTQRINGATLPLGLRLQARELIPHRDRGSGSVPSRPCVDAKRRYTLSASPKQLSSTTHSGWRLVWTFGGAGYGGEQLF